MPMPRADTPAHTPIALARSAGTVKTLVRIDSVDGMMKAAPAPMRARVAMRTVAEPDSAESREPTPKTESPKVRARLRPKRSPRLPAVSSRPAKTIV